MNFQAKLVEFDLDKVLEIVKLKTRAFMKKDYVLATKKKENIQDLQGYPYLVFENTRTLELTNEVYRITCI